MVKFSNLLDGYKTCTSQRETMSFFMLVDLQDRTTFSKTIFSRN
jgi:hypothetical protein